MNENKNDLFASLKKDLEKELEQLKKEKEEEREKFRQEAIKLIKKELAKTEEKNTEKLKELETRLRQFCYWLFGIALVFLVIIMGAFFYLRSLGK